MEEQIALAKFILLHLSSQNPGYALEIIQQATTAEFCEFLSGQIPAGWPRRIWLSGVKAEITYWRELFERQLGTECQSGVEGRPKYRLLSEKLIKELWPPLSWQPAQIWYSGSFIEGPYVTVVGPRRPSSYATNLTAQLVSQISCQRTVVSGLAFGTDIIALRAAVNAGGRVVVVLPFGVANVYPRAHLNQLQEWVKNGQAMVVSEYFSIKHPSKMYLLWRNRLMAAMANWVFIPEAAVKSGTRRTAEYAIEANVPLAVLPADITRPEAAYSNLLLRDGAQVITSAEDWFSFLELDYHRRPVPAKYESLVTVIKGGCFEPEAILANLNISPSEWQLLQQSAINERLIIKQPDGTLSLL